MNSHTELEKPTTPEEELKNLKQLISLHRKKESMALAEKILENNPQESFAFLIYNTNKYYKNPRLLYNKLTDFIKQAERTNQPANALIYLYHANFSLKIGHLNEAKEDLGLILSAAPNNFLALSYLAYISYLEENFDLCRLCINHSLKNSPAISNYINNPDAQILRGLMMIKTLTKNDCSPLFHILLDFVNALISLLPLDDKEGDEIYSDMLKNKLATLIPIFHKDNIFKVSFNGDAANPAIEDLKKFREAIVKKLMAVRQPDTAIFKTPKTIMHVADAIFTCMLALAKLYKETADRTFAYRLRCSAIYVASYWHSLPLRLASHAIGPIITSSQDNPDALLDITQHEKSQHRKRA